MADMWLQGLSAVAADLLVRQPAVVMPGVWLSLATYVLAAGACRGAAGGDAAAHAPAEVRARGGSCWMCLQGPRILPRS